MKGTKMTIATKQWFESEEYMEQLKQFEARRQELMQPLINEGVPMISAMVMAGDLVTAERASEELAKGKQSAEDLLHTVGSYARFDWAVENLPRHKMLELLPSLWSGADPSDNRQDYLALWREAYRANGNKTIIDDEPLPRLRLAEVSGGDRTEAISEKAAKGIANLLCE
jgi:hypothetical protein